MSPLRSVPPTDHDRRRLRVTWWVLLGGVALGVIGAGALAALGLDGRVGFAAVVLGCALGCVGAGLTTAVMAIVDEAQRRPVATRRVGITLGLFAVGAMLLVVLFGLAGVEPA